MHAYQFIYMILIYLIYFWIKLSVNIPFSPHLPPPTTLFCSAFLSPVTTPYTTPFVTVAHEEPTSHFSCMRRSKIR